MTTVFAEWKSYDRAVVPAAAPPVQREECRRAFYAGAVAMHKLVFAAIECDDEAENERQLAALDVQVREILTDLRLG